MDAGDPGAPAPHAGAGQPARDPHPAQRPVDVPADRGGGGGARRVRSRVRLRDHRVPVRQLVLHPAVLRVHDRPGREPLGPGDLPRGRRGGEPARCHGVAPHCGRGARRAPKPRRSRRSAARCRPRTTRSRSSSASCRWRSTPATSPCSARGPTTRGRSWRRPATPCRRGPTTPTSSSRCTAPRCWCCRVTRSATTTARCSGRSPGRWRSRCSSGSCAPTPSAPRDSPRRTSCAPRCSPPSPTTCGRRSRRSRRR